MYRMVQTIFNSWLYPEPDGELFVAGMDRVGISFLVRLAKSPLAWRTAVSSVHREIGATSLGFCSSFIVMASSAVR